MPRNSTICGLVVYLMTAWSAIASAQSTNPDTVSIYRDKNRPENKRLERSLVLAHPLLYLGKGWEHKIKVLDVSNPTSPTLLSSIPIERLTDFDAKGQLLYISSNKQLGVIDYANPKQPRILSKSILGEDIPAHKIRVIGDILCLASYDEVYLFDLSNPLAPLFLSKTNVQVMPGRFEAGNGFVFVSGSYHNGSFYSLVAWKDPRKPKVLRKVWKGYSAHVWDQRLLLPGNELMDMSDPEHPKLLNGLESLSGKWFYSGKVHYCENMLFALHGDSQFTAIDITDEQKPKVILHAKDLNVRYTPTNISNHNRTLYVEHPYFGLRFYDVANPAKPVLIYESCPQSKKPEFMGKNGQPYTMSGTRFLQCSAILRQLLLNLQHSCGNDFIATDGPTRASS